MQNTTKPDGSTDTNNIQPKLQIFPKTKISRTKTCWEINNEAQLLFFMNNKKLFYPTKYFVYFIIKFSIFNLIISIWFPCHIFLKISRRNLYSSVQKPKVKLWMSGQYNFITIFYFFDIQAPILISIRNFSSNKIFFKISFKNGNSVPVDKPKIIFIFKLTFLSSVSTFQPKFCQGKIF